MDKDPQAQLERFKQTARELGCDEDEAVFDEKLKDLAKQNAAPPLTSRRLPKDDE
jgi:branched-subunit amino acid aminotransferase/4-amino-4-deoxychorismate lyase